MADGKTCWDCLHRYTATSKEPCVHCFDVVKDKSVHPYWKAIDQQCELCEYAAKKATETPCDICYNRRTYPEFKQKERVKLMNNHEGAEDNMKDCCDCVYSDKRVYEYPCKECLQIVASGGYPDAYFEPKMTGDSIENERKMKRSEILTEANNIISGSRKAGEYGQPEDNFSVIAGLWSEYLDQKVKPHDVAAMMALVKVARIKGGAFKLDNWIDLAGYAACGGECQWRELADYAGYETERQRSEVR